MTHVYDDFDEFEFDDSLAVRKMLQDMHREDLRRAVHRKRGNTHKRRWIDLDDEDDKLAEYEDFEDYEDYDDDEFDSYA